MLEETPASHLGISQKNTEDDKEKARKAARDEQQRIQEQYKILLQRQMDVQQVNVCFRLFSHYLCRYSYQTNLIIVIQQQQQSQLQQPQNLHSQRMHNVPPQTQFIQANNININNNYMPINGNCNDKKLLRSPQQQQQQQQYKYLDRRSLFPPETKEEYYSGVRQVNLINPINFLKLR